MGKKNKENKDEYLDEEGKDIEVSGKRDPFVDGNL